MGTLLTLLVIVFLVIILLSYSIILNGWIFYKFWYWFVLPVFPELPEITFYAALGLTAFASLLKATHIDELSDEYKDENKKYLSLIWPWLVLFLGWMIHIFIS